ncbi:WD domain, G-beta repeat protein [Ostertagia ostertagi]
MSCRYLIGHPQGPITVLKRVSTSVLHQDKEGINGSVGTLCGTASMERIVVAASWVDNSKSGVRVWWLDRVNNSLSPSHFFEIDDLGTVFAIAADMQMLSNGMVLLAVGTTKRSIDLYCETACSKAVKRALSITAHEDWVHSIAFNQSYPVLLATAGQDSYVKLWRIENETEKTDVDELNVTKNSFKIAGADGELSLSISSEAVLAGHDDWVHSTSWDSAGQLLLTSSSDKTIIIWRETSDGKLWSDAVRLGIVGGQAAGFFGAAFSPDARQIVASSYFGGLYAWVANEEADVWDAAAVCSGHVGAVRDVAWHPSGKMFISVGEDKTTRVYIPQKEQKGFIEVARPQVHGHSMQCIAVVSSSVIVTGAEEKIFRAFQASKAFAKSVYNITGSEITEIFGDCTFPSYGARVPALGLSNKAIEDFEISQFEGDGDAHWEEAAFQAAPVELNSPPTEDCLQQNTLWPEIQKLYGHGYEVYAIAVNPAGTVLATSCKASQADDAGDCIVGHIGLEQEVGRHQLTVTQLEWCPAGTRLLSVSRDRKAILYREQNGDFNGFCYEKLWSSSKEHSRIIWSCCWFEDSQHFVTASRDMQVIIWKCNDENTAPVCSFKCLQAVTSVAVCCGSELRDAVIAAGLQDGSVVLLDLQGNQLRPISHYFIPSLPVDSPITRLRVNPRDRYEVAVAGSDGKLRVLRLSISSA